MQKEQTEAFGFSVRTDVFEEQLAHPREEAYYTVDGETITIPVDAVRAKEIMLTLYEQAVPYPSMPGSIRDVMEEELLSCLEGNKSAVEAGKVLQNRVQLYLDEL